MFKPLHLLPSRSPATPYPASSRLSSTPVPDPASKACGFESWWAASQGIRATPLPSTRTRAHDPASEALRHTTVTKSMQHGPAFPSTPSVDSNQDPELAEALRQSLATVSMCVCVCVCMYCMYVCMLWVCLSVCLTVYGRRCVIPVGVNPFSGQALGWHPLSLRLSRLLMAQGGKGKERRHRERCSYVYAYVFVPL